LAPVWERLDESSEPPVALTDLPVRDDMKPADLSTALGRRWRKDHPDFWGAALAARRRQARRERGGRADHAAACGPRSRGVHRAAASAARRAAREARRDAAAFSSANSDQDLRSSALNGSMDDREDDVEEERWR
jgi:hypothetical protein